VAKGENTADHPKRKVGRESFGQGEALSKVGGTYIATKAVTPEMEDRMSHDEWLSHMTRKHGHSGQ
jgi:hypothetical protein